MFKPGDIIQLRYTSFLTEYPEDYGIIEKEEDGVAHIVHLILHNDEIFIQKSKVQINQRGFQRVRPCSPVYAAKLRKDGHLETLVTASKS